MGDSITAGSSGVWFGTPNVELGRPFSPIFNKGVPGQQTGEMVARFSADILAHSPHVCVILAGVNNIGSNGVGDDFSVITSDLATMYTAAINAGVKVIACTIMPKNSLNATQRSRLTDVNNWIRAQASPNIYLCDWQVAVSTGDGLTWNPAYSSDGLHPNTEGALAMGAVIKPVLQQVALALA